MEAQEWGRSPVGKGMYPRIKAARVEDTGNRKKKMDFLSLLRCRSCGRMNSLHMRGLWVKRGPGNVTTVWNSFVQLPRVSSPVLALPPTWSRVHLDAGRLPPPPPPPPSSYSCRHYATHRLWYVLLCTSRQSTPSHRGVPEAQGLYFVLLYFKTSTINIYSWKLV